MSDNIILLIWLAGALICSRYVFDCFRRYVAEESWDGMDGADWAYCLFMTIILSGLLWWLVLPGFWMFHIGKRVGRMLPGGVARWAKWLYTVDKAERKEIFAK